jgi:hypothetical protein
MPEDAQQGGPACCGKVTLNGILQDDSLGFCVSNGFQHTAIITDLEISSDGIKHYLS